MMTDVVVTDTNIFIDLFNLRLLAELFNLPLKIHTLDFVLGELRSDQREAVLEQAAKRLTLHTSKETEVIEIASLKQKVGGNLSFVDCAAWLYAKKNNYILLTGDRQLRNKAQASNVQVHGLLFLFDQFVDNNVLSKSFAADKLSELLRQNARLPKDAIQRRIEDWRE